MLPLIGAVAQLTPSIITADREESKFFSSHYSTEVVNEKVLKEKNHFDDLQIPGLTKAGGTARSRYFQIRGIGERSSYEGMPNSSVSVIIDDIDYTNVGGVLSLNGLENLEVYKGPQNTLIGPSALAGMIIGQTHRGANSQNSISVERSSFNGINLFGEKSYSSDKLESYFSAQYQKNDGYFKNNYLNRDDTNGIEELSLKTRFDYQNFTINLHYFDFKNGYDVFNFDNGKTTISDKPGSDNQESLGASLKHLLKRDHFQLESIFSGHLTKTLYAYDEDWGNDPYWNQLPGHNADYDYNIRFTHDIKTFTLEERLTLAQGRWNHRSGLYYKSFQDESREHGFKDEAERKDLQSEFEQDKLSLYHESEFSLSSSTHLFFGGRIEHVSSQYTDNSNNYFNPQEALWGARIGLHKKLTNNDFYFSLARGFKPGGVNIGSNITTDRRLFQEESLYLLSLKGITTHKRWSLKGELFFSKREDVQVKTSYQDNPSDPSSFTFYTDNGTDGESYGAEVRLDISPTSWWQSSLSSNFNISEYGNYQYGSRNLKGRNFSYAPEYTFSLENTFQLSSEFKVKIDHQYQDNFYFGNSHDQEAPKTLMTNLSLNYQWKDWVFHLWGRNIFNERSETRGFFFGNRPPNYNDERFVQVGPPATYGLKVTYNFN